MQLIILKNKLKVCNLGENMNKEFVNRINHFKSVKRLITLSIEALIGESNTKKLMYSLYNQKDYIVVYKKMYEIGGYELDRLLHKLNVCNENIAKLEKGDWVEIQEDYLPTKKQIEKSVKETTM